MKALVLVLTNSSTVAEFVSLRKTSMIPRDLRLKGLDVFSTIDVDCMYCEESAEHFESKFFTRVLDLCKKFDMIACLVPDVHCGIIRSSGFGLFAVKFSDVEAQKNPHNFFSSLVGRWWGNFTHLANYYRRANDWKKFLLPYRAFDHVAFSGLGAAFSQSTTEGRFKREIDIFVSQINRTITPRERRGRHDREMCFKDNKGRLFSASRERHAEAETSGHPITCRLEKELRFGARLDVKSHFNVSNSNGSALSGCFETCHGSAHFSNRAHLNVFPNNAIE